MGKILLQRPRPTHIDSRRQYAYPQYGGYSNRYLGTEYNGLGQVVKTGWVWVNSGTVENAALNVTIADSTKLTETQYYKDPTDATKARTWVKHQAAKVLKPAGVSTIRDFIWSYIERRPGYEYTGNPIWTGKQHLLSQTYRYGSPQAEGPINDDDNYGVDWYVSGYDGLQKPTLTLHYLFSGFSATEVRSYETFTYDNGQRLTNAKHMYTLNGGTVSVPTFTLSNMTYNAKDQLTLKKIGNVNGKYLQSTDYLYNPRGWLTNIGSVNETGNDYPIFNASTDANAINSPNYPATFPLPAAIGTDNNPDLFTEKIAYGSPDTNIPGGTYSQHNGNISQVVWQIAGREKQAYSFRYDNLDRLTDANYADIHNSTFASHGWSSLYQGDNKYQEKVSYDLRGNIQSVQRNGLYNTLFSSRVSGYFGQIDNLTYTYDPTDKNKLLKVADAADLTRGFTSVNNTAATHYTYDANGNLTSDVNKGITNITYNYLNLPMVITFTNNRSIKFVYDATGAKLQKIVNDNVNPATTLWYVNGVEYNGNTLERIPHTEGEIVKDGSGNYVYQYALKDHLGNRRVTFVGNTTNLGTVAASDIKQVNHYYPFGMNMEGPAYSFSGANKYQYNEKELNTDFGLNWNDYGARWYDASIGRWLAVDPLAEMYGNMSPYHYGMNNPIRFIDPTGMASEAYGFGMGNHEQSQDQIMEEQRAKSHLAAGQSREVRDDDIKTSGDGDNIVWEGYRTSTTNTVTGFHFDCGCPNPPCFNGSALKSGVKSALVLAADDATGIGVADDILIPVILIGATAKTAYDNRELLQKYAESLARTAARSYAQNIGYQYALRATTDGDYPIMVWGKMLPFGTKRLKAGDVWKYGESTNPDDRYAASYLRSIGKGVVMDIEFTGTLQQVKMMEKTKIFNYAIFHGELPPGNKMFK